MLGEGLIMEKAGGKIFTLNEARAILPEIKSITGRYCEMAEELRENSTSGNGDDVPGFRRVVEQWAGEIASKGAEPKGLWLVDFDSGDGFYFCWQFGEEEIEYIHSYDGGFAGRRKIAWSR